MTKSGTSFPGLSELVDVYFGMIDKVDTLSKGMKVLIEVVALQDKIIDGFYDAVNHGDEAHRLWLRETIDNYRAGYAPSLAAYASMLRRLTPEKKD